MSVEEIQMAQDRIDSIAIDKNSKNTYTWAIKLYYNSNKDSYDDILSKIKDIDAKLRIMYGNI